MDQRFSERAVWQAEKFLEMTREQKLEYADYLEQVIDMRDFLADDFERELAEVTDG